MDPDFEWAVFRPFEFRDVLDEIEPKAADGIVTTDGQESALSALKGMRAGRIKYRFWDCV